CVTGVFLDGFQKALLLRAGHVVSFHGSRSSTPVPAILLLHRRANEVSSGRVFVFVAECAGWGDSSLSCRTRPATLDLFAAGGTESAPRSRLFQARRQSGACVSSS